MKEAKALQQRYIETVELINLVRVPFRRDLDGPVVVHNRLLEIFWLSQLLEASSKRSNEIVKTSSLFRMPFWCKLDGASLQYN